MSSTSTIPREVAVTQLGLSSDEVAVLQHAQREAAAGGGSSSSRAASRASSQGMLILDSSSLAQLGRHFDRLMQQIAQQLDHLTEQSQIVTMMHYDAAGNLIDNADAEIRRFHMIMAQIEELEVEFDRIRHIRDIVRGYRQRVQELEQALESSQTRRGENVISSTPTQRPAGMEEHGQTRTQEAMDGRTGNAPGQAADPSNWDKEISEMLLHSRRIIAQQKANITGLTTPRIGKAQGHAANRLGTHQKSGLDEGGRRVSTIRGEQSGYQQHRSLVTNKPRPTLFVRFSLVRRRGSTPAHQPAQ